MEEKVILAGFDEIKRRGLKFTMDDITRRLHISKTSLYKMVPSKNALIAGIIQYKIDESSREEQKILSQNGDAGKKLKDLVRSCVHLFGFMGTIHDDLKYNYVKEWNVWETFRREKIALVASLIQEGAREGVFRPVDPALVQEALLAAVAAVSDSRFLRDNNISYEEAIDGIMDVVLHGIEIRESSVDGGTERGQ